MEKKIIILISFIALLSTHCYAQDATIDNKQIVQSQSLPFKLVEPSADGIYQRGDVIIKFFPPAGWKKVEWNFPNPDISFMQSEKSGSPLLSIDVLPPPSTERTEFFEQAKGALAYGNEVLQEEFIPFLDTEAYSCITIGEKKIKQKNIIFIKANRGFQITFTDKEDNFDVLLPTVDESLKTFEFISSAPK